MMMIMMTMMMTMMQDDDCYVEFDFLPDLNSKSRQVPLLHNMPKI